MRGRRLAIAVAAVVLVVAGLVTAVALRGRTGGSPTAGQALVGQTAEPGAAVGAASGTAQPTASRTAGNATSTGATPTAGATRPGSATGQPPTSPTAAASGGAPLAGRIRPGVTYRGVATFYAADGSGACSYDRGGSPMTAAMNWADYEGSRACGGYVLVRASTGATVTVRITNECPAPCRVHQLDLSPQAFAVLANPKTGQIDVTWRLLSPGLSGGIAVRYKVGSSRYWCGIQVIDHRNPVATLELRAGSTWRRLTRTGYNYFLSPDGTGCGGGVRITDIYGQRLLVGALPVRPDVTQPTGVQFDRH